MVGKFDFNENPVVSMDFDFDFDLGFDILKKINNQNKSGLSLAKLSQQLDKLNSFSGLKIVDIFLIKLVVLFKCISVSAIQKLLENIGFYDIIE